MMEAIEMPEGRCDMCGVEDVDLVQAFDLFVCPYCALSDPDKVDRMLLKSVNRKFNEIEKEMLLICPEFSRDLSAKRHFENMFKVLARRLHVGPI
jgi:predicted GH43/DUF377 family glycosyl hydrolase